MSYEKEKDAANIITNNNSIKPVLASHRPSELSSLSITSDSIVVTVFFTPNDDHRAVQIHWGDDSVESIDFEHPMLQLDPNVPQGSYKIQHVYGRNPVNDQFPSRVYIILVVYNQAGEKSFEGRAVDIVPRYRCVIYPTLVKATHHDSAFEEVSEFDIFMQIRQGENILLKEQWRWEPKTFEIDTFSTTVGIIAEKYLDGSYYSTEMTWADDPIQILTHYVDDDGSVGSVLDFLSDIKDFFIVEFDTSVTIDEIDGLPWGIHPARQRGPFSFVRHYGSNLEYMDFHISGSMEVIVPVDRGPIATMFNT
jgi:hypothetical protein